MFDWPFAANWVLCATGLPEPGKRSGRRSAAPDCGSQLWGFLVKLVAQAFSIAAAVLTACAPAIAEQTEFTVVVQDYKALPPYSAYENKEYTGFNRDILDMFAAEKGYTFTYVAYPVKRLFFEFVNGVGDLKYPDNPNWALQVKKDAPIVYSDPVVDYINGVMVLPANQGQDVDEIKTLGLVAGWTPIRYLDRVEAGTVEIRENNDYAGLLKQTMLGRNDGADSNVASSRYYLKNILKQPDALVFDETLPHVRSARSLASIKHPEIIAEFNRFLEERSEDIAALKREHAVEDGVNPD